MVSKEIFCPVRLQEVSFLSDASLSGNCVSSVMVAWLKSSSVASVLTETPKRSIVRRNAMLG